MKGQSVIYAGVASGNYKGSIHYSEPSDGLFRSEDNGQTWQQVLPDIPEYGEPYAVSDIDMGADGRIYVGTMPNVDIEGGAVILYSDEGLSGSWWVYDNYVQIIENNPQYKIPGRVMVAPCPHPILTLCTHRSLPDTIVILIIIEAVIYLNQQTRDKLGHQ